jgi:hypothetical protein
MADVRLTAVNPENSEVYPVACNDKGELVLNGASRLDVSETLDVASTTYADNAGLYLGQTPGNINFREIRLNKDGSAQFSQVVQVGGFVSYVRTDATDQNLASFNSNVGGLNVARIIFIADGSATFANNVNLGGAVISNRTSGTDNCFVGQLNVSTTSFIKADGSATFAGGITASSTNGDGAGATSSKLSFGLSNVLQTAYLQTSAGGSGGPGGFGGNLDFYVKGNATNPIIKALTIGYDGTATFAGKVTAPNITFRLAPATVAAMPAPLIDDGFAVNEELDLLSELIKMKLQIRDLNAFMQRTLQDASETTQ